MPIKVLIADDHAIVRDGLRFILESDDHIIVVGDADNGRQAVSQVQRLLPDIAVLDIAMPELNGIDAAARIYEISPSVGIIILSMHATKEHIFRALKAGAQGYLLKESAGKEVVKAVHIVHSGRRYLSDRISEIMIDDYMHYRQTASPESPIELLSNREREILQLVAEGRSSAHIADTLCLSPKTIETYRSRVMQKLGIKNLAGLIRFAIHHGLTSME